MRTIRNFFLLTLVATFALTGCVKEKEATDDAAQTSTTEAGTTVNYFKADGLNVPLSDSTYTIAGVSFNPPAEWKDEGTTSMRKTQLSFGPIEDEADSATMVLFYFGADQGGPIQANLDRWVGQVPQADSSDSKAKAVQSEFEAAGMKAHVVEVTGAYNAGGMAMGKDVDKAGYLLVGVVLEGPEGNLFFKLTGPEKTAAAMAGHMAVMFESIKVANENSY